MSKKVAYVTGGMGGIGTAICQRLHNDGYTVIEDAAQRVISKNGSTNKKPWVLPSIPR